MSASEERQGKGKGNFSNSGPEKHSVANITRRKSEKRPTRNPVPEGDFQAGPTSSSISGFEKARLRITMPDSSQ